MTVEKAIEIIEDEALELFFKANCYECNFEQCPEYKKCRGRVDDLNDIAKHLRDLKKIKEIFVR